MKKKKKCLCIMRKHQWLSLIRPSLLQEFNSIFAPPPFLCVIALLIFLHFAITSKKRFKLKEKKTLIQAKINTQVGGENKRKHSLLFVVFQVPSFGSHGLHSLLLVLQPIWLQPENSRRYIESVNPQKFRCLAAGSLAWLAHEREEKRKWRKELRLHKNLITFSILQIRLGVWVTVKEKKKNKHQITILIWSLKLNVISYEVQKNRLTKHKKKIKFLSYECLNT